MKIVHIYPRSCEYAYPKYLNPELDPDLFDLEIMCNTDLEVRYLKGLHELGEDCVLFYPRRYRLSIKEFQHRGGYRIVRFPITLFEGRGHWGWELPFSMLSYLKLERPDLVHFHGIVGGRYLYIKFFEIIAFYCKINKIPFFGWYHVGQFPHGRRFPLLWAPARFFKTKALRLCAGITSINQEGLGKFFDPGYGGYFGVDFSMIPHKLTPNTVDTKLFYPMNKKDALEATGLDQSKRYVLMVARLFFEKGLHLLLEIMPDLIDAIPDVHLLVIGEFIQGEEGYIKRIKTIIRDLDIREYVTFKGRIEHHEKLVHYYNSADVFVLPTLKDMFPAVNLEALACGIPVISTDCGEIPYLIKRDLGIVVPKNDPRALLKAILRVLLGDFCITGAVRTEALNKYDYRSAARSLRDWYIEILN